MEDLDYYRRQLTRAETDRRISDARLQEVKLQQMRTDESLMAAQADNLRMKSQIERISSNLQLLRSSLEESRAQYRQVYLEDMIRSLSQAIESGSRAGEGLVISDARADISIALMTDRNGVNVLADSSNLYAGEGLSRISLTYRSIPPAISDEELSSALAGLAATMNGLQGSLEPFVLPDMKGLAGAVFAKIGEFVAGFGQDPGSVKDRLTDVVKSLNNLSQDMPAIATPVQELTAIHAVFPQVPSVLPLRELTDAVTAVSVSLKAQVTKQPPSGIMERLRGILGRFSFSPG